MSLKDAIQNLNSKIASAAGSATAEELAYLATAAERIGGRVSVFELADYASEKTTELDAALATARTTATQAIVDTNDDALTELAAKRDEALAALRATTADSTNTLDLKAAASIQASDDASATSQAQILAAQTRMLDTRDATQAQILVMQTQVLAARDDAQAQMLATRDAVLETVSAAAAAASGPLFGLRGRFGFSSTF